MPQEESVKRLLSRGVTSGRSDDNETVIRNRLKEYHEKTLPVLQFYKDRGIYQEVDGTKDVDNVNKQIRKIIKNELSKKLFNIVIFGYPGSVKRLTRISTCKKIWIRICSNWCYVARRNR